MGKHSLKYFLFRFIIAGLSIVKFITKLGSKRSGPSIVLIKIDHLGDLALFSGVLKEISTRCGKESIILIANKALQEYIDECPFIKRAIYFNKSKQNSVTYLVSFLIKLPFINPQLVANCNYSRTIFSDLIAYAFNAKRKVGFTTRLSEDDTVRKIDEAVTIYTETITKDNSGHELELHALFLNRLFKTSGYINVTPGLWSIQPGCVSSRVQRLFNQQTDVRILICPDGSFKEKFYGFDNFKAIMRDIASRVKDPGKLRFFIIGTKKIDSFDEFLETGLNVDVQNISGTTNLSELFYIINSCDILIGNDSGPAHISLALKKMTFVVYGGGHYGRFFPYPPGNYFKGYIGACNFYGCKWNCKMGTPICVSEILPEMISMDVINHISRNAS
ncbi:MAG: glycosyltransferase family 9 protein [Agriterribacter sp.]